MIFTRRTLIEVLVPLKPLFSKLMEESLARSISPRVLICQCLLRRKATVPNVCLMFSLGCHFSSWTNQARGGALRLGDIRSGGVEGSAKLIPGGSNFLFPLWRYNSMCCYAMPHRAPCVHVLSVWVCELCSARGDVVVSIIRDSRFLFLLPLHVRACKCVQCMLRCFPH